MSITEEEFSTEISVDELKAARQVQRLERGKQGRKSAHRRRQGQSKDTDELMRLAQEREAIAMEKFSQWVPRTTKSIANKLLETFDPSSAACAAQVRQGRQRCAGRSISGWS